MRSCQGHLLNGVSFLQRIKIVKTKTLSDNKVIFMNSLYQLYIHTYMLNLPFQKSQGLLFSPLGGPPSSFNYRRFGPLRGPNF